MKQQNKSAIVKPGANRRWAMVGVTATLGVVMPLSSACPEPEETGRQLTEWAGASKHLQIEGTLNDETLSFDLDKDEANSEKAWCQREYEVPLVDGALDYEGGQLVEVKVGAKLTIGDEERTLELELKKHDFQSDSEGTTVTIVRRSETQDPAADEMWLEWEWNDIDVEYEEAAVEGTFTLGTFTGNGSDETSNLVIPDNEGTIGGFVSAKWSDTEEVKVSFTLDCTVSEVVEIQPQ